MSDVSLDYKEVLVALRKESVDRNTLFLSFPLVAGSSLSARRAWIEIDSTGRSVEFHLVALRKESVDRNSTYVARLPRAQVSLSARRAWIEIILPPVDTTSVKGRSPQGERG